ncbi:sugar ABC transporter permease [Streptococcus gallolyticus]|uniref:Sugar ABC transporter permease n=1 Tax=Streptococcus gallolyticus TaxID=315405 RepID=A0AA94SA22_9STRE|nr:carbohydrate ABC transporter permease [Streptococcus gallolyticus]AQP42541.1 putative sugar ABC transporter permease [Streptococcus gallolyticus subsp. gallolyticus DSM 16831]SQG79846.1 sugar ABC transporter permease [Streptococcus gallolyticus]
MKQKDTLLKNIISICLLLFTSITLVLLAITFMNSFKTSSELASNTFGFPKAFTLDNYVRVLTEDHFFRYLFNSLTITLISVVGLIFLSAMVAYGISRYEFKHETLLSNYFLLGMMFPVQLCVMPLFVIMRNLGLLNTISGVILLYIAGMSFPVFTLTKFFRNIPASIEESARIDGASDFRIFFQIILPITRPVLFTLGLINGIRIWNDFYIPMVFLSSSSKRTLMLSVYKYMSDFIRNWDLTFAAVILTLLPILLLYILCSRQIVDGATDGAEKG